MRRRLMDQVRDRLSVSNLYAALPSKPARNRKRKALGNVSEAVLGRPQKSGTTYRPLRVRKGHGLAPKHAQLDRPDSRL